LPDADVSWIVERELALSAKSCLRAAENACLIAAARHTPVNITLHREAVQVG